MADDATTSAPREWNAPTYHRVSSPQFTWGQAVLDRLPLRGNETVLDVGCGTGRLTELLAGRLPHGRAIGIDQSVNMLATARTAMRASVRGRVTFVQADAAALPIAGRADAIFSTATFHWVLDHDRLFRSLFAALTPGGRLVAQCGGGRQPRAAAPARGGPDAVAGVRGALRAVDRAVGVRRCRARRGRGSPPPGSRTSPPA